MKKYFMNIPDRRISDSRNSVYICLLLITIFAFLLRFFYWTLEPLLSRDAITYLEHIQAWTQPDGNGAGTWMGPPLYLFLIQGFSAFGFPVATIGILINLVVGSFVPIITYGIAQEICNDKRISLCSAILMAVHPSLITESIAFQRDTLYFFLIGLLIYCFILAIQRKQWYFWAMTGICLPLASLTRYESLEFLPIIIGSIILAPVMKYFSWKNAFVYFFVFSLSCLIFFVFLLWVMGLTESQYSQMFDLYRVIQERILFFRDMASQKGTL